VQIIAEAMLFSYKADWRGVGRFKCFSEIVYWGMALRLSGRRFAVYGVDVTADEE